LIKMNIIFRNRRKPLDEERQKFLNSISGVISSLG
jgi:hypothetical protein